MHWHHSNETSTCNVRYLLIALQNQKAHARPSPAASIFHYRRIADDAALFKNQRMISHAPASNKSRAVLQTRYRVHGSRKTAIKPKITVFLDVAAPVTVARRPVSRPAIRARCNASVCTVGCSVSVQWSTCLMEPRKLTLFSGNLAWMDAHGDWIDDD
ncbi:unnamed protein product, partial [Iphiclides podalirius]